MPMSKAGKKIMANLKQQYGEKKGEGIFYAMENKGEIPGMKKKGYNVGGQVPKQPSQRQAQQMSAFNRNQERAMNASRQIPAGPGGIQARQASSASARQPQVGAMPNNQVNQTNAIEAQKRAADAAAKGLTPRPPRATNPNQAGAMQTQQAAAARRRQTQNPNTPDTAINLRNRELALKMAASRGPTQQALKAPANVPQTNSAMQQFNTNQTNALAKNLAVAQPKNAAKSPVWASVTQANNATKLANMFKKPTAAPSPAAAPRSNRFSRQAAKAAPKPMMAKGGMVKANCGASMKPTQKSTKK